MDFHNQIQSILTTGIRKLGLNVAIVSVIQGDSYKVYACDSGDSGIKVGDHFELSGTYCSDVIKKEQTKFYEDVAEISEMLKHPCYQATQLRAYIGTPIILNNQIWGTLNYSSMSPHKNLYSTDEIKFIEHQAKEIAALIQTKQLET